MLSLNLKASPTSERPYPTWQNRASVAPCPSGDGQRLPDSDDRAAEHRHAAFTEMASGNFGNDRSEASSIKCGLRLR